MLPIASACVKPCNVGNQSELKQQSDYGYSPWRSAHPGRRRSGGRTQLPDKDIDNPAPRTHEGEQRKRKPLEQLRSLLSRKKLRQPVKLTEDHILSVVLVRKARDEILGKRLFSDPAWDIMLELYAARLGGRSISLPELIQAIEAPQSTTERWLKALESAGLTTTTAEGTRVEIILTLEGASKMARLANHWGTAFLSV